jgi:propanol-preferring alcohol dehydrogenase
MGSFKSEIKPIRIMIPLKMKAAVAIGFGKELIIQDMPVKRPDKNEILVKVMACGVCHTDLHAVNGDWPIKPNLPFIPGHEGIGYVAALGENVDYLKEGDIVGVPWLHTACGHCEHCLTGWETLCAKQKNTGYSVDGSYAEYVIADARYVGQFPSGIDFMQMAPIVCAGITVYKGLKETEVKPGEWVSISGVGGLGHVAIQYAKAMGMHVAAIDISDDKLILAKKLGAEVVVNASKEDPGVVIKKETKGGVHGSLVTAVSPIAFRQALFTLRSRGTLALTGLPPGNFALPIFETVLNAFTIRGSIVGTRKDLQESIDFALDGKVRAIIHAAKLEDINTVMHSMQKGEIEGRVVLKIQD